MTISVTTSWDDGHVLDLRVAELLERYGLTGTFYIARDFLDERMSEVQLRDLARRHEVGAHTLSHPVLTEISLDQAREEIQGSKLWLQDVLGQDVTTFCYPKGANNTDLQHIVKEAGYIMARTVEKFAFDVGNNPYAVPTTFQIYPYPLRPLPAVAWWRGWQTRIQPLVDAFPIIRSQKLSPNALFNWQAFAESLLQQAQKQSGVLHIWGHSWEVERYNLWDEMEELFATISADHAIQAVTNSALVERHE